MVTPGRIITRLPIHTSFPITTGCIGVFHAGDRIAPRPVDAHNGDIGNVADGHMHRVDDEDINGAGIGQL